MLRLFIAVPLPPEVEKAVHELLSEIRPLFRNNTTIRFVKKENWHFTLAFLGYQGESVVPKIKSLISPIKEVGCPKINAVFGTSDLPKLNFVIQSIQIKFDKLTYGPLDKTPRMIWLTTTEATSHALHELKQKVEDELEKQGISWRRESRPFQGHLTLARFELTARRFLPNIEERVNISFHAPALTLMKSTLKREGAEYEIL